MRRTRASRQNGELGTFGARPAGLSTPTAPEKDFVAHTVRWPTHHSPVATIISSTTRRRIYRFDQGSVRANCLSCQLIKASKRQLRFKPDSGMCGLLTSFDTNPPSNCSVETAKAPWQPVRPPKRDASEAARADFQASMLLPGFSTAFHAATLNRSRSSILTYRRQAQEAASRNPAIGKLMLAQLSALTAEDGRQMARLRGGSQLPHFALLAICEFRERGLSRREIASDFRCSPGTVAHALQFRNRSYEPLSGVRRLTSVQRKPPGQFRNASRSRHN